MNLANTATAEREERASSQLQKFSGNYDLQLGLDVTNSQSHYDHNQDSARLGKTDRNFDHKDKNKVIAGGKGLDEESPKRTAELSVTANSSFL